MSRSSRPSRRRRLRTSSREVATLSHPVFPKHTFLQGHIEFFDLNKDGKIMPWETFRGFNKVGFPWPLSLLAMGLINGTLSYGTLPSWIPHPLFPIYVANIRRSKHGSDTQVYDKEGRFDKRRFEELFIRYDPTETGGLTLRELLAMTANNRDLWDPYGWTAAKLEWGATYFALRDKATGMVPKDRIRGMYDGTIWEQLARDNEQKRGVAAHQNTIPLATGITSILVALIMGAAGGAVLTVMWVAIARFLPSHVESAVVGTVKWALRLGTKNAVLPAKWTLDMASTFWRTLPHAAT